MAENFTASKNQTKTLKALSYPGFKVPSKPVCGYDETNAGCNDLSTVINRRIEAGVLVRDCRSKNLTNDAKIYVSVIYCKSSKTLSETDEIIAIIVGSTCALVVLICAVLMRRKYTKETAASHSWMIKFEDVQYPRDVQEWLRRRYTIIDDGAGGLAVAEAVRMAKKAVAVKNSASQFAPDDEQRRTTLGPGRTISHKHGIVNGQPVTIRYCHKDLVPIVARVLREAKLIRSLKANDNIMQFVGASVEWKKVAIFYEYCSKGTLQVGFRN